ncbi:MAG: ABC transporter permease [Gemmatimonadales bacterium]
MTREARAGIALLITLAAFAIVVPLVAPDPLAPSDLLHGTLRAPSGAHLLGTDQFSRDVLARLAYGARISLGVAAIAVSIAAAIGAALGLAAGAAAGGLARLLGGLIDLALAVPRLIVLLVLLAALGRLPAPALGLVLGLTGWPAVARLVRGETLRLRHAHYVTAARALGATPGRVVWRDIFPGTVPALLVASSLGLADAVLLEAGLSFIGVGVRPPAPSWGGMLFEARDHLTDAPWLLIAPSLALVAATFAATLLGDALRRSLQPESA